MARKCFFNAAHTGIVSYPVACTDGHKHYVCYDCQEHAPCDNDNRLDVTFKQKMQNGKFYCFDIRDMYTENNISDDIEMQLSDEEYNTFLPVLMAVLSYVPRDIKLLVHISPYCFSDGYGDFDGFYDDDEQYIMLGANVYEHSSYNACAWYRGCQAGINAPMNEKRICYIGMDGREKALDMGLTVEASCEYGKGYQAGFDSAHDIVRRQGIYVEYMTRYGKHHTNSMPVKLITCQENSVVKLYRVEYQERDSFSSINYAHKAFSYAEYDNALERANAFFDSLIYKPTSDDDTTTTQEDDNDMHEDINTESLPAIDEPSFYQLEEHNDKLSINIEENAQAASMTRRFITGISTLIFAVMVLVTCFGIMSATNHTTSYAATNSTCTVHKYAHKAGYYKRTWSGTVFYASPPAGCTVYNGPSDSSSNAGGSTSSATPVATSTASSTPVATSTASSTPVATSSHKSKHHKSHTSSNAGSNAGSTSTSTASSSGNNAVCTFDIATNGTHQRSCNGTSITIDVHVKPHHKQD